jgi:hypothetical protein
VHSLGGALQNDHTPPCRKSQHENGKKSKEINGWQWTDYAQTRAAVTPWVGFMGNFGGNARSVSSRPESLYERSCRAVVLRIGRWRAPIRARLLRLREPGGSREAFLGVTWAFAANSCRGVGRSPPFCYSRQVTPGRLHRLLGTLGGRSEFRHGSQAVTSQRDNVMFCRDFHFVACQSQAFLTSRRARFTGAGETDLFLPGESLEQTIAACQELQVHLGRIHQ